MRPCRQPRVDRRRRCPAAENGFRLQESGASMRELDVGFPPPWQAQMIPDATPRSLGYSAASLSIETA
jgi:hypothetical protein